MDHVGWLLAGLLTASVPAGGRRHPHRQREGGGQTLHGFHRQCHRRGWAISIPLA